MSFVNAVEYGKLENMKWLKDKKCPWNEYVVMKAIEHGNNENIDWLLKNKCPYELYSIMGKSFKL